MIKGIFVEPLVMARYRFSFVVDKEILLPEYAASALRGVMGHALRKAACMTRQKDCHNCPLIGTCPYIRIFETPANNALNKSQQQHPPQPYIIEPSENSKRYYAEGDVITFNLVLIGDACHQLALITFAFIQAFKRGVGKLNGTGKLLNIEHETMNGWKSILANMKIQEHQAEIIIPETLEQKNRIQLLTPLQLQHNGRIVGPKEFSIDVMLKQLIRRLSAISTVHWHKVLSLDIDALWADIAAVNVTYQQLSWCNWTRYSNRQQQKIVLKGIVGEIVLENLSALLAQALYSGQWLHVGKETVFGYGKYRLLTS